MALAKHRDNQPTSGQKRPNLKQKAAMRSEPIGLKAVEAEENASDRDGRDGVSQSRALVALHPADSLGPRVPRSRLTNAMFLAQMVATRFKAPQTCVKRRAEPAEANAHYRSANARMPMRPGGLVMKDI